MGYIGNQDYSTIEINVGNMSGKDTEANILAKTPTNGELWVGTDTGKLYLADGTSWTDIGTLQGDTGPQGAAGNGITSITRTSGDGSLNTTDTYTITYSDGSTSTFDVTNGTSGIDINGSDTAANILARTGDPVNTLYVATDTNDSYLYDGAVWNNIGPITGNGIQDIQKTGTTGLVDTYTITYTDATTATFTVNNGKGISTLEFTSTTDVSGLAGASGATDTYTITYNDGTTQTFDIYNGLASAVTSVAGRTGDVVLTTADIGGIDTKQDTLVSGTNIKTINGNTILGSGNVVIDADTIGYDNTTSGLTATNVQEVIDELDAEVDALNIAIGSISTTAEGTSYDNTESGLGSTTVQGAIDELVLGSDVYTGAYGLNWDQTNDTYLRTGSNGYTAIQAQMRRCVLHNDASSIAAVGNTSLTGTVNYYLHPENSNFKADGSVAVLDGTDGNVMVEVPKFYYKYNYNTTSGVVHEHSISLTADAGYSVHDAFVVAGVEKDYRYFPAYEGYSDGGVLKSISGVYPTAYKTITTFRTEAKANGAGYRQIDWLLYEAITLLIIIEYGTMNIQQALGQGRTGLTDGTWVGGSLIGITGLSNKLGNGSGNVTYVGSADDAAADGSYMTYRGCENFYGNLLWIVDGVLFSNNVPYINQNPSTYDSTQLTADDVSTGVTMAASWGYARELGNSNKGFFPTSVSGGGNSVGTTDYFGPNSPASLGIAMVGSAANGAPPAGPLSLRANNVASTAWVSIGAGVSY